MKRTLWICSLTLLLCASVLADCPAAEKRRLEEFDRNWSEVTRRGDRAALNEIFADDYVSLSPTGPRTKSDSVNNAVLAAERQRASGEPASTTVYDNYRITCTPTTAVITHRAATTNREGQTNYFRSVHVLEKRGGRWQVVSNAGHASNDTELLVDMEHEWAEADAKHDVSWYERNLASDFVGVSFRTGELRNRADEIAEQRDLKERVESADVSDMSVRISGDTGIVNGIFHLSGRDEQGKPFDRRFRFTDIFVKRGGRWQLWSTHNTPVQP